MLVILRSPSLDTMAFVQGRRHGFETGGGQFCERSEQKKLTPHFLASGGGGQNIA